MNLFTHKNRRRQSQSCKKWDTTQHERWASPWGLGEGSWRAPGLLREPGCCSRWSKSCCSVRGHAQQVHVWAAGQTPEMSMPFPRHSLRAPRQTLTNKLSWKICRKLGISTGSTCRWRGCSGRCEDPPGPSEAPSSWRSWIHCSGPGGPLFCLAFLLLSEYGFSGTRPGCWPQTHCSFHPASWFSSGVFHTCMGTVGSKHKGRCQACLGLWEAQRRLPGPRVKPMASQNHRKGRTRSISRDHFVQRFSILAVYWSHLGSSLNWPCQGSTLD